MAKNKPVLSPLALTLTWTVVVPLFAILSSAVVLKNGPQVMWSPAVVIVYPFSVHTDYMIRLEAQGTGPGVWTQAYVWVEADTSDAYAEVDLKKMQVVTASPAIFGNSYQTPPPSYASPQPLTDAEVLSWFGFAGIDTTKQSTIDESAELASIIAAIPSHGMTSLPTSRLTCVERAAPIYGPAGWLVQTLIGFWLIVWLLGFVVHIVLWRRSGRTAPAV